MPLIAMAALTCGCDSAIEVQMPAGGPSGHHEPARIAAERRQSLDQKIDPLVDFGDDLVERRIGRQHVTKQCDIDAMRHRAAGQIP